jgi:phosphoserine phosphatase RsbU/P
MKIQHKILIADDSVSIQNSIHHMLLDSEDNEFNIIFAANGHEACIHTLNERPDLILMDIEMPRVNGIEAIRKIKNNNVIKSIPIIIMSSTKQFQEAFDVGADDFLVKPFNKYELLLRIHLNLQLAEKRSEVKKKHELLKAQKQEAIVQRDTILEQKTELLDGLQYARLVQIATLPSVEILKNLFDSHFVFNRPKNIVSGDFYWLTQKKEFIYIAVGDCTGHGMSGALMSMAGAAFLNEIVLKNPYISADEILNQLRDKVIQLLNQKGNIGEMGNGMDIALCIYDKEKGNLQFAGANSPVFLAHKNELFDTIKGDRMPIGYYFNSSHPFTKKDRKIVKGDTLYLFTDGYPDQFGGPNGQKLKYNRFYDLIQQANNLNTMDEQYEFIKTFMDEWMEGFEQIDDILIVGIKF